MRDDFLTRDWADQHHRMSDVIKQQIKAIALGLKRLHDHQFDAPWRSHGIEQPRASHD